MATKFGDKDEKCKACGGAKTNERMTRVPCEGCGGGTDMGGTSYGSGQVTSDEGGVEIHEECNGLGYKHEPYQAPCEHCKGTGEPTVKVGWGYGGNRSIYTKGDIDKIMAGDMPKPDVMLLARHKTNSNEVVTFKDAQQAADFKDRLTDLKKVCTACNGASAKAEPGTPEAYCSNCHGNGATWDRVPNSQAFDIHAVPTERVGHDRMEYEPSSESWKVKDGKGTKIDWDGGTKLDWQQLDHSDFGGGPAGERMQETENERHRQMREGQPDYVNQVLPRVARNTLVCPHCAWKKVTVHGHRPKTASVG